MDRAGQEWLGMVAFSECGSEGGYKDYRVGVFGDKRIDTRASQLHQRMLEVNSVVLRGLSRNRAEEVAFGRLLANEMFSAQELVQHAAKRTAALCRGYKHVLLLHDTTDLRFDNKQGSTRQGLGPITDNCALGLMAHPVLAVDAATHACLGLASVNVWARSLEEHVKNKDEGVDGQKNRLRRTPIEAKESFVWIEQALAARATISSDVKTTLVADRESDIYQYFDRLKKANAELITRASYDRSLSEDGWLYSALRAAPAGATYEIHLPSISGKRAARNVKVEVRYRRVLLRRPRVKYLVRPSEEIELWAVEIFEPEQDGNRDIPPKDRLLWRLLTTHEISTSNQAIWIAECYKVRWLIEQLFRLIKTEGLHLEASQMETKDGLIKLTLMAFVTATKILQLTQGRENSHRKACDVFDKEDHSILKAVCTSLQGKTTKQQNPYPERSLAWASWVIARLGGWKGYESERPPGPITMRKGLEKYQSAKRGWLLARALH